MVRRGVGVREAEHGQRPGGRRLDQPDRRPGEHRARALGADQRLGEVDLAGQQLVQVVAGDAAGEVGEAGADVVGGPLAQRAQAASGIGAGAGRAPQRQPLAAVGEHVQADDVVDGLAPRHRVRPARVVADHPAERAAVVRGRVGAERQPVRRGGVAHGVADHAGLDAGGARVRVDLQDPVDVHEVQDDGGVHRLARDRGPRADRQHGHVVRPAHRQRRLDVRDVARARRRRSGRGGSSRRRPTTSRARRCRSAPGRRPRARGRPAVQPRRSRSTGLQAAPRGQLCRPARSGRRPMCRGRARARGRRLRPERRCRRARSGAPSYRPSCARIGRWSPAISGWRSSSFCRCSQVRRIRSTYSVLPL